MPPASRSSLRASSSHVAAPPVTSLTWWALFALLATAQPLPAQETGSTEGDDISPPAARLTEQVVVTATRIEIPQAQAASAVTVITADDLANRQDRLVVDALRQVPGLDVRRTGGPGSTTSIFIRGADSDHTLVLLDGVELNDPSSPSRLPFLDHLTTDAVERIEIVRGPQSTLYGGDAIGGVINIITRRGKGKPTLMLLSEGGSYDTYRGSVASAGAMDGFDYSITASHANSDGFSAQASGTESDPYRNTTGAARLGWAPGDDFGIDVLLRHTDARIDFDAFSAEEGNRIRAQQTLLKVGPHFRSAGGRWQQDINLQLSRHERDTTGVSPSLVKGRLLALDWQNNLLISAAHTLVVGAAQEWEQADFPTFDDSANTLGLYVQDQFNFKGRMFGSAGVRTDRHSSLGMKTTGRLTGGYRFPTGVTTLRGSFGTGFKPPALSQLNASAFGGNPDLKPERSWGADMGVDLDFMQGRFALGVTAFQNRIDDLILAVFDPAIGQFRNLNVDRARTRGVETYLGVEPLPHLLVRSHYTYTDTEALGSPAGFGLTPGSSLLRRPRHKGSLDVHYTFPKERTDLTMTALYVGRRRDINPADFSITEAGDYTVMNLSGSWKITGRWRILGRVDNVLDRGYQDVLGFSTAGRSGYAGISVSL